jgi:hypothetical protein
MKRYLKAIIVGLASLSLVACLQAPQPDVEHNQAQSAVEVKSQVKKLDLKPLSSAPLSGSFALLDNATVEQAFAQKTSDVWVQGAGVVTKLLPDDNKGSRHQKFLVRINAKQTLLFAHNIDLSNRIDALKVGDSIEFKGEYVFNPKGGVIHWTHRDPKGQHEGGWIKHQGNTFE